MSEVDRVARHEKVLRDDSVFCVATSRKMRVSLRTFSCRVSRFFACETVRRSERKPLFDGFRIFSVVFVCAGSA